MTHFDELEFFQNHDMSTISVTHGILISKTFTLYMYVPVHSKEGVRVVGGSIAVFDTAREPESRQQSVLLHHVGKHSTAKGTPN